MPKLKQDNKDKILMFRVNQKDYDILMNACKKTGKNRSILIREAFERFKNNIFN